MRQMGLELTLMDGFGELDGDVDSPGSVVIDIGMQDALQAVADCRDRWSQALIAGFLATPDKELWTAAESAGCDLVANRGALVRSLIRRMQDWKGVRRMRLASTQDIAGRIGVLQRMDDSPLGAVAVYHIEGEILVTQDTCPHAGARLSEGELNLARGVITCPRHGSQFNLRSGEGVRGPADYAIETHQVEIEGSEIYVRLGKDAG